MNFRECKTFPIFDFKSASAVFLWTERHTVSVFCVVRIHSVCRNFDFFLAANAVHRFVIFTLWNAAMNFICFLFHFIYSFLFNRLSKSFSIIALIFFIIQHLNQFFLYFFSAKCYNRIGGMKNGKKS